MEKRKPRFSRVKIAFKPTERDLDIVRHIARHRFLTTQHIRHLVNGGLQGVGRRLHVLYHAGVLDRPRAQLEYFHRGGSKPMVYGLGPQGARLLYQRGENSRIDWTAKNRNATKLFIEHTLRVADFMVAVEVGCRAVNAELKHFDERPRWNISWHHARERCSLGVIPDAVFALSLPGQQPLVYCVEVDCATMPVKRRSLQQTSACRKFLAYHATWRQEVLSRQFGWKRFRVLTLTTSQERAENLRRAARQLPSGHGLFLFNHFSQIDVSDVLKSPWHAASNESAESLLPALEPLGIPAAA